MILQADVWEYVKDFFGWVAQSQGIMVVLTGLIAITWLGYERKRRGSFLRRNVDEFKFDVTKFLRALSYLGLILGILCVWSGIMGMILKIPPSFKYRDINCPTTGSCVDYFTSIYLIIMGMTMFLKPINDLPWSGILGLIAGSATAFIIAIIVPDSLVNLIGGWINPKWLLVIIFIVVTAIVALSVKFYISGLMGLSKLLSWPPIAIIIVVVSLIQGLALWGWGISIIPNLI